MYKLAEPFFIRVITPLHAGSGQDLGIVDLPIQRERHMGFPKIEASGLKGSVREVFEEIKYNNEKMDELKKKYPEIESQWKVKRNENGEVVEKIVKDKDGKELTEFDHAISLVFGPENSDSAHAGALGFTDAKILLFPVKSAKGVFAWITCPKVLERFKKDMKLAGENVDYKIPKLDNGECLVAENSALVINDAVILEEYAFKKTGEINKKIENALTKFTKISADKLLILSDDDFTDFVNLSTEVITRTKIDNKTGTVQTGALFTEEYLPSETIMYSLALATSIFSNDKGIFNKNGTPETKQVLDFWKDNILDVMQVGGNATIGKGIVEIIKEAQ